jgi:AraC-like DNA-binding protein
MPLWIGYRLKLQQPCTLNSCVTLMPMPIGNTSSKISLEFTTSTDPTNELGPRVWEQHIGEQFNGIEVAWHASNESFQGSYRIDAASTVRSCLLSGTRHSVHRSPSACGPEMGILKVISGRTRLEQGGQSFDLAPSSIILFDNSRPYQLDIYEDFEHTVFLLDREDWSPEALAFERYGYKCLPESPFTKILGGLLENIARTAPEMTAAQLQQIAHPVTQFALIAMHGDSETKADGRTRQFLFQRICADIRNRLSDPDLTPIDLAQRHRISLRYLHKIFAMNGMSVMGFVRHERLAKCSADMRRCPREEKLATIAARWGFDDYTSFRRAFALRYGVSPSAFSANHQKGPISGSHVQPPTPSSPPTRPKPFSACP